MSNELVSEAAVESALDFLRDSAVEIGNAKARVIKAEAMVKHRKALMMARHNDLPVNAQEREAVASPEYEKAINEHAEAAGEYEKLRAYREAASMKIEVWRSMNANWRSMRIA
jgi:hypothetical protein